MGTRGLFGFRVNDVDYLMYNQFDSYPGGLGQAVVEDCALLATEPGWDAVKEQVQALHVVDEEIPPTTEDVQRLQPYTNLNVSEQTVMDWYCLTSECQGSLRKLLASGYLLSANTFILDSLFCEWAYIVNLDTHKLEVWQGFQNTPDPDNRYGTAMNKADFAKGYYPCKMLDQFDLDTVTVATILDLEERCADEE